MLFLILIKGKKNRTKYREVNLERILRVSKRITLSEVKFSEPNGMSEFIWLNIVFKNRLYLTIGTALCLLYGMFNLQFRGKFVKILELILLQR
jgi:hypothetical protein